MDARSADAGGHDVLGTSVALRVARSAVLRVGLQAGADRSGLLGAAARRRGRARVVRAALTNPIATGVGPVVAGGASRSAVGHITRGDAALARAQHPAAAEALARQTGHPVFAMAGEVPALVAGFAFVHAYRERLSGDAALLVFDLHDQGRTGVAAFRWNAAEGPGRAVDAQPLERGRDQIQGPRERCRTPGRRERLRIGFAFQCRCDRRRDNLGKRSLGDRAGGTAGRREGDEGCDECA